MLEGRLFRRYLGYAWHGYANQWWLPILGALLIWGALTMADAQLPFHEGLPGFVEQTIAFVAVAWVFIFMARLAWAPPHFWLAPRGGLRRALRASLGTQMWPIVLMGAGIICFVVLFGAGLIGMALQNVTAASAPPKAKETELANAAPKIEPLPSGAKFRRGEHVFYYVREPYTPKEAADILEICEELDNYLQVKFLPIIGSLQEYTKSIPQNIKLIGGPKSAQTHIHDIDVTLLIPAYEAMTPIIGKYPTHREAINEFLLDKGEFGSHARRHACL
jgi:hypothetical protein